MIPRLIQRHFVLMIVAIVVLSRVPTLLNPLLTTAEADYAVQAVQWMNGGIPFVDFVHEDMLIVHTWIRGIFSVFGAYNMLAVHIMNILLVLATIGGLYVFARYVSGEKVARWAAILYALAQSWGTLGDVLPTAPVCFLNAFAIFGSHALFKSMREDRPGMSLFAGMLMGIAMLASWSGIAILAAGALSMVFFWYEQEEHRWHRYVEEFALLLVGVAFPLVMIVAYVADAGGLDGFLFWPWPAAIGRAAAGISGTDVLVRGVEQLAIFASYALPLLLLGGWVVVSFVRRRRWRTEVIYCVAWCASALILIVVEGRFAMQDFMQLLPPLCVLAGIGIVDRWETLLRARRIRVKQQRMINAVVVAAALVVPFIAFLVVHVVEGVRLRDSDAAMRSIAAYVRTATQPSQRIFVWGHDPGIYFFSRRLPAARFIDCSFIIGVRSGYPPGAYVHMPEEDINAWVMVQQDFRRHPPALIVDLAPTGRKGFRHYPLEARLFLANYVRDHYRSVKSLYGAHLYLRGH